MSRQRILTVEEIQRLRDVLEDGTPVKDFWNERELIERLVLTICELAHL